MQQILPNLYLSSYAGLAGLAGLASSGAFIVNCTKDLPMRPDHPGVRVAVDDDRSAEALSGMLAALPGAVEQIDQQLGKDGGQVVVHCQAGQQRSPAVVAAYLIAKRGYTPDAAVQFIRTKKPDAFLWCVNFRKPLDDFHCGGGGVRSRPAPAAEMADRPSGAGGTAVPTGPAVSRKQALAALQTSLWTPFWTPAQMQALTEQQLSEVSRSRDVTWEVVTRSSHLAWDWGHLTHSLPLDWGRIEGLIDKPWDFLHLSRRHDLDWGIVRRHIDRPWDFHSLSRQLTIDWDTVLENGHKPWDVFYLLLDCSRHTWNPRLHAYSPPPAPKYVPLRVHLALAPDCDAATLREAVGRHGGSLMRAADWDCLLEHIDALPWDFGALSRAANPFGAVRARPDKPWDYALLSGRPDLPWGFVALTAGDLPWDFKALSWRADVPRALVAGPRLTRHWNWDALSLNRAVASQALVESTWRLPWASKQARAWVREAAARVLQAWWLAQYYDPASRVCQRRLRREFASLMEA